MSSIPLEKSTTVYLIRHGEYDAETSSGLSEEGLHQAEELARRLSDKHIEFIFSSPVTRAVSTAKPLAEKLNLSIIDDQAFGEFYPDGDEKFEDALRRTRGGLERIVHMYQGKTLAITTHGFMIGHFLISIGYGTREELAIGTVKNGSYVELAHRNKEYKVTDTYRIEKVST